jgi:thiamine-phosphate pyrophosphorylase
VKLPRPALLLVTDRRQARGPLSEVIHSALAAGCRWISVREKDLSDNEQVAFVRLLAPMSRRHGARLTLHGEAALAIVAGADGVHLPAGSDAAAARALLGPDKLIGVSIHTATEASANRARRTMPLPARPTRPQASQATVPKSVARASPTLRGRPEFPLLQSGVSMPHGPPRCSLPASPEWR